MSSYRKDARWALVSDLTDTLGLDSPNDLPYAALEALLVAADGALNHVAPYVVEKIARGAGPDAARPAPSVESLLDTKAGLTLASAAWQEGASGMLKSVNQHESGPWSKPTNPYSEPLLAALSPREESTPDESGERR